MKDYSETRLDVAREASIVARQKKRAMRVREAHRLLAEGHTKSDIIKILDISATTLRVYLNNFDSDGNPLEADVDSEV